jgi:DNA-binding NtrC family response regulator
LARPSQSKILIVDDDELLAEYLKVHLEGHGFADIRLCFDGNDVAAYTENEEFDLILLDLILPGISGREILEKLHRDDPGIPVIIITAQDKVDTAVDCMKAGAFDFLTKPVQENRLLPIVQHALRIRELQTKVELLETGAAEWKLKHPEAFREILTESDIMYTLFVNIEAISMSPKAVLITGESGTGKDLVAKAVHRLSGRKGDFVAVNVSGLDDSLFSDTLFGHTRGAYTGAEGVRKGLVEQAAEGTLFLDEIGDLEPGSQVKLLRLLQEGEFYPIGSDRPSHSRTRIVAATNADLRARLGAGTFRADLYYRLIAHHLELPPLRDRKGDQPLLIKHFVAEAATSLGREAPRVPEALLALLADYSFPGNIRELGAILYDAVGRSEGAEIGVAAVREYLRKQKIEKDFSPDERKFLTLKEVEENHIREALRLTEGNQSLAAKLLGISQSTLSRRSRNPAGT